MNAQEIINYIAAAPKKTPVKAYVRVREGAELDLSYAEHVFGLGSREKVVFADWAKLGPVLAPPATPWRTSWWRTTAATLACPCSPSLTSTPA